MLAMMSSMAKTVLKRPIKKKAAKKAPAKKKPTRAELEHERRLGVLDVRQASALEFYADPKSESFGNMKRSFIRAGFTESYADNITNIMPNWLSGFMGEHASKLAKVERNIHKFLDLETAEHLIGPNGPVYEDAEKTKPKMVENPRFLELQLKMTTFVAERLNRKHYGKDDKVNIGFSFNMGPVRSRYTHE